MYYYGCIIFSVGERKNSLPTLIFLQNKEEHTSNLMYNLNHHNQKKGEIICVLMLV